MIIVNLQRLPDSPEIGSGYSREQWAHDVHGAKAAPIRVFVSVHLLAGGHRDDSTHELAPAAVVAVLTLVIDLERHRNWDLMNLVIVLLTSRLEAQGAINVVGGRPPCDTLSKLRFLPQRTATSQATRTVCVGIAMSRP